MRRILEPILIDAWSASWPPALVIAILLAAAPATAAEEAASAVKAAAGEEAAGPPAGSPDDGAAGDAGAGADKRQLKWEVEGYLAQEARLRNAGSETDVDLYTTLSSDVTYHGTRDWTARVFGRLFADVSGEQDPNDLLRDQWDNYDHAVQGRLYEAYAETGRLFDLALTVRGGRQFLDEGVYLHFDGVRLDLDLDKHWKGVDLSAIFGVPVKFGEPSRSGEWLAGLVVRIELTKATRIRLEYFHVSEDFGGINDVVIDPQQQPVTEPAHDINDDLFGLSVWHRLTDTLRFFGRISFLEEGLNEVHLRLRWFTRDGRWTVVAEWYQMLDRLRNVTNDLTPFVPLLGAYEPFIRVSLRATRRFGESWTLQAGASLRELEDEGDEGEFNREYVHYFGGATRFGLAGGRLDLTLTVNGYATPGHDVVATGGHADYRLTDTVSLAGGVDYSLFKYDWFQDTEREDVWSYSARIRWQARKKVKVTGGVSVDDDRFETYTTVFLRVTVRF